MKKAAMKNHGFLAIWCDMPAEHLQDYRDWLTKEHIADRTFSPGFLGVRLFEALEDETSHFILYATQDADVLNGAAYRAILDNPSDWTRRIMPKFGPFDRALGEQVLKVGNGFGPFVVTARIRLADASMESSVDLQMLRDKLAPFAGVEGIVSLRLYALDHGTTDRHSEEKTMRGGTEGDFDWLLCAEAMGDAPARRFEKTLAAHLAQLFPALARFDIACRRMIYGEAAHEGPTG